MIEPVTIWSPNLPPDIEGLTVAHLTDLHIRRPRARFRRIAQAVGRLEADLVFLTGDYMSLPGDEDRSLTIMTDLCSRLRSRLGVFGVFGNHDTPKLREMFQPLPVQWLDNACHRPDGLPLDVIGFEADDQTWPDIVTAVTHMMTQQDTTGPTSTDHAQPLRLLLCHYPTYLPTASDLGVDIMFAGHTHGGQWRLPGSYALFNSTDMPLSLTSGILRHRDTLCVVSRGLGENWIPLRFFCPPHLPVYTLRRGPLPGRRTGHVENVVPW